MIEDISARDKFITDYLERLDCPIDVRIQLPPIEPEPIGMILKSEGSIVRQWLFTRLLQFVFWFGKDVKCRVEFPGD